MLTKYICSIKAGVLITFLLISGGKSFAEEELSITWPNDHYRIVDSLKQLINTQSLTEEQLLDLYCKIGEHYHAIETDSTISYTIKSIPLAIKLKNNQLLGDLYVGLGVSSCFAGDFKTALDCFDKVEELGEMIKSEKLKVISVVMKAFAYAKKGNYNTSIGYYLKALKVYESMGDTDNCITVLANLSEINRLLGNTEMALFYLKQADELCDIFKKENEFQYRWRAPQVYNEFGYNYLSIGDFDKALHFALKADSVNVDYGTINKCGTYNLLASIFIQQNDYDHALHYAEVAYKYADILKDVNLYVSALQTLSDIYLAQKRYLEAEIEALKAWQIDSTNINESRNIAKNIAMANIYMDNTEKAAYFFNKYAEMNMQFSEKSFHTTVSDLSIQYDIEKKQVRIASLEKERQLYLWLATAGVLLLIALVSVLWQTVRNAHKKRQLIASKAIKDGEIGERERIAKDLHDRLGSKLAAVKMEIINTEDLQSVRGKLDQCMNEIREITHDLMPISLSKFGLKSALEDATAQFSHVYFHFFGSEERFEQRLEYTIYCCTNELMTNAIKHSDAENINVQLVQSKKYLSLTVQDDGCGFDEKSIHKGMGIENVRNRVTAYAGNMDIVSFPGKGTEVVIGFRY